MNIILKEWTLSEKENLVRICNHMDHRYLSNGIPSPYKESDAVWWIDTAIQRDNKEGIFRAIICDGKYVGNISVEKKADVYSKDAEIGYFLVNEESSKGIMTEAVRMISDLAWSKLDIIRITGLVYQPNIASKKVLEKNGFALEGVMKNAVNKNGQIYDLCIYGKYRM